MTAKITIFKKLDPSPYSGKLQHAGNEDKPTLWAPLQLVIVIFMTGQRSTERRQLPASVLSDKEYLYLMGPTVFYLKIETEPISKTS